MRVPTTDAITRRSLLTTLTVAFATGPAKIAVADDIDRYHDRVRNPSQLLLQQDYYYIFGTVPPRQITAPKIDQPQWNAFGSCVDNAAAPTFLCSSGTTPMPSTRGGSPAVSMHSAHWEARSRSETGQRCRR